MVPNCSLDRHCGRLDHLATSTIPRKVARSLAGLAANGFPTSFIDDHEMAHQGWAPPRPNHQEILVVDARFHVEPGWALVMPERSQTIARFRPLPFISSAIRLRA